MTFTIITDPGDGPVSILSFNSSEERLAALRELAQERFPGQTVPMPLGWTDESQTLAQLLGFFLMLSNGSVTLSEPG